MKELSRITDIFTESVIREMTRVCDAAGGVNLSQGFPDFACSPEIKAAAIKAIQSDMNQYPVTFGEPELRHAISAKAKSFNGIDCNPETEITVTCGSTEGMIATLTAIINPGDEIIIFEPFYENYGPDSILSGATPRYVTLYEPEWKFDPDELARAFNVKTKAIIINTPNNPTGKVFSREELAAIAELCQKWDVLAITDEIYEHILYDGKEHISIASLPNMKDRTITVNSISKTYSVTGWRVGWVIASERITRRIRKVHDFLTVGAPTPFQWAATAALDFPKSYYADLSAYYLKARNFLFNCLKETGFDPILPGGAYYIMTGVSKHMERLGADNDFSFSRKLILATGVASVPGSAFYCDANKSKGLKQVRFTYCKKWETLQKVEAAFAKFRIVTGVSHNG